MSAQVTDHLYPAECPDALRRWADASVVGRRLRNGRERIAGWRWDGISDEIVALVAPKGERYIEIPRGVFERAQRERAAA